jgi:hypothetical protein
VRLPSWAEVLDRDMGLWADRGVAVVVEEGCTEARRADRTSPEPSMDDPLIMSDSCAEVPERETRCCDCRLSSVGETASESWTDDLE